MSIETETGPMVFGGQKHTINSFKLIQLEVIVPTMDKYAAAGGPYTPEGQRHAYTVIAAALDRPFEEVAEIGSNIDEIHVAVDCIAEIAGLKRLGERLAERRASRSTSTASMPSLSPAASEPGQTAPATSAS